MDREIQPTETNIVKTKEEELIQSLLKLLSTVDKCVVATLALDEMEAARSLLYKCHISMLKVILHNNMILDIMPTTDEL